MLGSDGAMSALELSDLLRALIPQGVEYDFLHLDDSQSAGMPTTLQPGKNLFILFVVSLFCCLNKVKEKGHIGLQK